MQLRTFHENIKVVAAIYPQTVLNTSVASGWKDMRGFSRVVFLLSVGATDGTIDASVTQAQDSSGTGSKAITGASITQITAAGGNRVVSVEVSEGALDNGYTHVQITVTGAGATTGSLVSCLALFYRGRDFPVTQSGEYAEQVTV